MLKRKTSLICKSFKLVAAAVCLVVGLATFSPALGYNHVPSHGPFQTAAVDRTSGLVDMALFESVFGPPEDIKLSEVDVLARKATFEMNQSTLYSPFTYNGFDKDKRPFHLELRDDSSLYIEQQVNDTTTARILLGPDSEYLIINLLKEEEGGKRFLYCHKEDLENNTCFALIDMMDETSTKSMDMLPIFSSSHVGMFIKNLLKNFIKVHEAKVSRIEDSKKNKPKTPEGHPNMGRKGCALTNQ